VKPRKLGSGFGVFVGWVRAKQEKKILGKEFAGRIFGKKKEKKG
jgi:hypothetical protein